MNESREENRENNNNKNGDISDNKTIFIFLIFKICVFFTLLSLQFTNHSLYNQAIIIEHPKKFCFKIH